jgi:hypothetical protein
MQKQFIYKHSFRFVGRSAERKMYLEQNLDTDTEQTNSLIKDMSEEKKGCKNEFYIK